MSKLQGILTKLAIYIDIKLRRSGLELLMGKFRQIFRSYLPETAGLDASVGCAV